MKNTEQERIDKSKKLISQYRKVFGTPDGEAVLYDMMKSNFIMWKTPHVPGDDASTFKNIGKQEVVKQIMHILRIDPEKLIAQINEQEGSHV
jgi:hypothetical protein